MTTTTGARMTRPSGAAHHERGTADKKAQRKQRIDEMTLSGAFVKVLADAVGCCGVHTHGDHLIFLLAKSSAG